MQRSRKTSGGSERTQTPNMHKYAKTAAEHVPFGYSRVRSGRILPDDLVWSLFTEEFLPADSKEWLQPTPAFVGQCCYVIRRGAEKPPEIDRRLIDAPQQTFGF